MTSLLASVPHAARLACAADAYHAVDTWPADQRSDDHLAAHVQEQGIHVAIDLTGPTHGGRPNLWTRHTRAHGFASDQGVHVPVPVVRAPLAPVQLHYLSSPATMFDPQSHHFTVTDRVASPPELIVNPLPQDRREKPSTSAGTGPLAGYVAGAGVEGKRVDGSSSLSRRTVYVERLLYIPPPFIAPAIPLPAPASHCNPITWPTALPRNARIASAAFNLGVLKLEPRMWSTWMNILARAGPEWLLLVRTSFEPAHALRMELTQQAAWAGVHPSRIIFGGSMKRCAFQQLSERVDVALDTRVYGMHSSTMDALHVGIPVVILQMEQPSGRVASTVAEHWLQPHGDATTSQHDISTSSPSSGAEGVPVVLDPSLLVTRSLVEFEDTAVALMTRPRALQAAKGVLRRAARGAHAALSAARVAWRLDEAYQAAYEHVALSSGAPSQKPSWALGDPSAAATNATTSGRSSSDGHGKKRVHLVVVEA